MSQPKDTDTTLHYDGPPTLEGSDGEEDFYPVDVMETAPPPGPVPSGRAQAPAVSAPPPLPPSLRARARVSVAGTVLAPVSDEARVSDASMLIQECNAELDTKPEPLRAARLHYEVARLTESPLHDYRRATTHYRKAHELWPDHVPSIRGARRLLLRSKQYKLALPLFDAEIRLATDPQHKASLMVAKGRALEDGLRQKNDARDAYVAARELDPNNPIVLKALEQADWDAGNWEALSQNYATTANAIHHDPKLRAAVMCQRARIEETKLNRPEAAIEIYANALTIDPTSTAALSALRRLHQTHKRYRELLTVIEHELGLTAAPNLRAAACYRAARVCSERLGDRQAALAYLERGLKDSSEDLLILRDLARLYEEEGQYADLCAVLAKQVELPTDPEIRLRTMLRVGMISEQRLDADDDALAWYQAALRQSPTHVPAIVALQALCERRGHWDTIVAVRVAEGEATTDLARRSRALAHAAELLEVRLNRAAEALKLYERALSARPENLTAFRALERLYASEQMHRELVALYQRAVDRAGDKHVRVTHLTKLAALYEDTLKDPAEASRIYQLLLDHEPESGLPLHALQRTLERAGKYPELVAALDAEITRTRDASQRLALTQRIGDILLDHLGDRDAALTRYRQILDVERNHPDALAACARALQQASRFDELVAIYERQVDAQPPSGEAAALLITMGDLARDQLGQTDRALGYYRRASQLVPNDRAALEAAVQRLREQGARKELADALQRVHDISTSPRDKAINAFRAGEVFEEYLNDAARAANLYETALQSDPALVPARDGLERIRAEAGDYRKSGLADGTPLNADHLRGLLRAAEIWLDRSKEPRRAVEALEMARAIDPTQLDTLLALELVYRQTAQHEELAKVYADLAAAQRDPHARAATLWALWVHRSQRGTGEDQQKRTLQSLLDVLPSDLSVMEALEQHAFNHEDWATLTRVDEHATESDPDPLLSASHLTRLGEALAAASDTRAITCYRDAVARDSENVAAIAGLLRLAEGAADAELTVEALTHKARTTRNAEHAGRHWMRCAELRLSRLRDEKGAVLDLQRALERWPSDAKAADLITKLLLADNGATRLVEILRHAAEAVKPPDQIAAVWYRVGVVEHESLHNIANALAAFSRATRAKPNDTRTLLVMARLHCQDQQWEEAARLLKLAVVGDADDAILCDAYALLAGIYEEHLNETSRALACLRAAMAIDDKRIDVLSRLASIYTRQQEWAEAGRVTRALLETNLDDTARAKGLGHLAQIELQRNQVDAARAAFDQAVALAGPSTHAAEEYRRLLAQHAGWERYLKALEAYSGRLPPQHRGPSLIEMARVQATVLNAPPMALRLLRQAIESGSDTIEVRHTLAGLLSQLGEHASALKELREVLVRDVADARTYRWLAMVSVAASDFRAAAHAVAPLVVLGAATPEEKRQLQGFEIKPAEGAAGALDATRLRRLGVRLRFAESLPEMLRLLRPAIAKIYPPELHAFGIDERDPRASEPHPNVRALANRIASIFVVDDFSLHTHRLQNKSVVVEIGETQPMVLVPARLHELPLPQQTFLLARALGAIACGLESVWKLTPREIEILVAATVRTVDRSYGTGLTSEDLLNEQCKRIGKALARKDRKLLDQVVARYPNESTTNFGAWVRATQLSMSRAAALVSGDLPTVVNQLRSEQPTPATQVADVVRSSEAIADVMRFWVSEEALAFSHS